MRKDVNRSAYTRRILEIVGNIEKQKEEIKKVIFLPRRTYLNYTLSGIFIISRILQVEKNNLGCKIDQVMFLTHRKKQTATL